MIGDVVGKPGREALRRELAGLREREGADLVIANAENAAGGSGLTPDIARRIFNAGVDVVTLGDHCFKRAEVIPLLEQRAEVLRPANLPPGAPGKGWCVVATASGVRVGVVNALGRIFTLYAAALGVGGIAGGCVCRFVLDRLTVPTSFGVLTLATAVGMALAGTPLLLFDDSRRGPSVTPPATLRVLLRERLRSFVARPGFVAYLAARTGIWLLLGCAPFITNHIRAELPSEGEAIVGELVVVMYVMMTFGSLASGWLADRVGFRPFLVAGLLLVGVGYGGLALVDLTRTSALALYGVTMMIWPVLVVGGTPYMRTIIPDARVTALVAVSAVLTCLPRIAVPLGLGYLRDAMDSYTPLLLCVTVLACLTAVMVYVAGGAIHRPGLGNGAP